MLLNVLLLIIFTIKNAYSFSLKLDKIKWSNKPDLTIEWENKKINYVNYSSNNKQAILLIHGFGASLYHWRYNIKELSKYYDVYAFDLLGFGKSSKNIHNYDIKLWKDNMWGLLGLKLCLEARGDAPEELAEVTKLFNERSSRADIVPAKMKISPITPKKVNGLYALAILAISRSTLTPS